MVGTEARPAWTAGRRRNGEPGFDARHQVGLRGTIAETGMHVPLESIYRSLGSSKSGTTVHSTTRST
jgi:hypothetical protein